MEHTKINPSRPFFLFLILAWLAPALAADTIVIALRHAEKMADSADPGLTPAGEARANDLARALADLDIGAVYSTPFHRTRQTALPLAEAKGLEILQAPTENHAALMAKMIREDHGNQVVVVVGHSNTTPALLAALGVEHPPEISDATYDRLYIVRLAKDGARLLPLRYGVSTP